MEKIKFKIIKFTLKLNILVCDNFDEIFLYFKSFKSVLADSSIVLSLSMSMNFFASLRLVLRLSSMPSISLVKTSTFLSTALAFNIPLKISFSVTEKIINRKIQKFHKE